MRKGYNNLQQGDSLIEVLVVSFILMTTLVALTSLTTISVARNRLSRERVVATRLAQEGLEWLKSERDRLGYDTFATTVFPIDGDDYCIPLASGLLEAPVGSPADPKTLDACKVATTPYYRWVRMDIDDTNDRITLMVSVWWPGQPNEITIQGLLTKWQK